MADNPVFINDDYVLAEEPDNNNNTDSSTLAQQQHQRMIDCSSDHDVCDSPMLHQVHSTDTTSLRSYCGTLVTNPLFQKAVVGLIIINSIQMGVGTYEVVRENPAIDRAFEIMDHGFLILFTVELCMQFAYHGVGGVFADGWLTFDFLVIFLSWTLSSFAIIRAFRIVRAVRLMAKIGELKALVQALIGVIPKMFAIGILLALVFYIFGVMFTQLFRDAYADGLTEVDYFSSLHRSFFTLFQLMTLENWSYITRDLMTAHPFAWLPMMVFILVSSFIVINLVIAVSIRHLHKESFGSPSCCSLVCRSFVTL